jgi:xanthosine phosphorylase
MTAEQQNSLNEAMRVIREHAPNHYPKVGMILGSGLNALADQIQNSVTIPYDALPGFSAGKVKGHASLLMLGDLNGVPVACMKGRLHLYEGIDPAAIKNLVRILKLLGCGTLVVTGAVGSLRANVGPGEIVMLSDHINLQPFNPLVGPNDENFGPRFLPMDDAYDTTLRELLTESAARINVPLHEGVYLAPIGPVFETAAEIRAFRTLGADVVGMSVVPEVIVARHCGMHVAGLTAVTNLGTGMSDEKISHEGTLHHGQRASHNLTKLISDFLPTIPY